MTQSLEGKWEDPNGNAVGLTIAEALVFKQWYVMRQLTTARMEGTALQSLTPEQKAALVAQWKVQSAGILDKYKVFQQWQAKVGDYPGTTSGIRDTYNRFSAQAAQLESQAALLTAQGKHADAQAALAEAARLKANLAAGDYGQFVKARDAYYAALAANPILGVKLSSSGPPLFETLVGTSNPAALQTAFDQSVNQFVVQLTDQINRVSQLANTKDLWQLGSSMYAGSNANAAAYGGDF